MIVTSLDKKNKMITISAQELWKCIKFINFLLLFTQQPDDAVSAAGETEVSPALLMWALTGDADQAVNMLQSKDIFFAALLPVKISRATRLRLCPKQCNKIPNLRKNWNTITNPTIKKN